LKLRLQALVPPLSAAEPEAVPPEDVPPAQPNVWHDSSMELERGLDVVELSVDLHVCDVPAPDLPMQPSIPKRR
jgi:hypothetical protein